MKLTSTIAAALIFSTAAGLQLQKANAQPPSDKSALIDDNVLHDPRIPVDGNSKGDLTVVEYFDYQCSTCKQVNPILQQLAREDGHLQLVFKDWPIFGDLSIYAAQLAIAAKFQDKFSEAHEALISANGKLSKQNALKILTVAGLDVPRIQRDIATNQKEIDAILASNRQQAVSLGFEGPPALVIGHFLVPPVFNTANFLPVIANERAAAKRELKYSDMGH
jgi:protein-disulfide isomerase